jgi:hypothetical protein
VGHPPQRYRQARLSYFSHISIFVLAVRKTQQQPYACFVYAEGVLPPLQTKPQTHGASFFTVAAEIDENLKRFDLTIWEQSKHIARREELMVARGERAESGTNLKNLTTGDTVSPVTTTAALADSFGMHERSYQRRKAIGSKITEETAAVLDV